MLIFPFGVRRYKSPRVTGVDVYDVKAVIPHQISKKVPFDYVVIPLRGNRTDILKKMTAAINSKGFYISPSSVLILYAKIVYFDVETGDIKFFSAGKFAYIKNSSDILTYFVRLLSISDMLADQYGIPHKPEKIIIYFKSISALNIPSSAYYKSETTPLVVDAAGVVKTGVDKGVTSAVDAHVRMHGKILHLKSEFIFKFNYSIIRDDGTVTVHKGIACIENGEVNKQVVILYFIKELSPDSSISIRTISPIFDNIAVRRVSVDTYDKYMVTLPNNVFYSDKISDGKII